jgi:carbon storage regulator
MLVLTRKPGQAVVVADCVCITVLSVHANHIKLGFTAPPEVAIHRKELFCSADQSAGARSKRAIHPARFRPASSCDEGHAQEDEEVTRPAPLS